MKTRGTFGEVQLGALLDQMLSPEQYAANVKTKKNATEFVEFAIKLPGKEIVMILYIYLWMPNFPKMYMSNIRMHTKPEMPH